MHILEFSCDDMNCTELTADRNMAVKFGIQYRQQEAA
jgi:hypothetical protein